MIFVCCIGVTGGEIKLVRCFFRDRYVPFRADTCVAYASSMISQVIRFLKTAIAAHVITCCSAESLLSRPSMADVIDLGQTLPRDEQPPVIDG